MRFFVVSMEIYRPGRDKVFRLFRPNLPEVEYRRRYVHTVVPHDNPDSLVRARPGSLVAGGLIMSTRGAKWEWDSTYGVWVLWVNAETEDAAAELTPLLSWERGKYQGPSSGAPYRNPPQLVASAG